MKFDKKGKLILPKSFKKIIKHEEDYPFDDDDFFSTTDLVNYEED